jgi:hypothetical protein
LSPKDKNPLLAWYVEFNSATITYIFPFGIGEMGRVGFWSKICGFGISESLIAFFIVRWFDIFVNLTLLAAYMAIDDSLTWFPDVVKYSVVTGFICFVLLSVAVIYFHGAMLAYFQRYSNGSSRAVGLMMRFLEKVNSAVKLAYEPKVFIRLLIATMLFWALQIMAVCTALLSLDIYMGFGDVIEIYLCIWLAGFLPVRGLAKLGTHELGWTAGLVYTGMAEMQAIYYATSTHFLFFGRVILTQITPIALYVILTLKGWQVGKSIFEKD